MEEKRRSKRLDVDMSLMISNIFRQDNVMIENIDAPIRVTNISKSGIGFETQALIPIGYYFNAKIKSYILLIIININYIIHNNFTGENYVVKKKIFIFDFTCLFISYFSCKCRGNK